MVGGAGDRLRRRRLRLVFGAFASVLLLAACGLPAGAAGATPPALVAASFRSDLNGGALNAGAGADAGDFCVREAGSPPSNGCPENEGSHLNCTTNIALYARKLAVASGTFTVTRQPNGQGQTVYSGSFSYNATAGGTQLIATIPISVIQAAGGGDFKVQLSDGKSKVIHVDGCAPPPIVPEVPAAAALLLLLVGAAAAFIYRPWQRAASRTR